MSIVAISLGFLALFGIFVIVIYNADWCAARTWLRRLGVASTCSSSVAMT